MRNWREKLNDILDNNKLFERNYKITCPCRFKINGQWINAKIDMDSGIIYDLKGNEIRRCNACLH